MDERGGDRRVTGARVRNLTDGSEEVIHADLVINAAGAWAGQIAQMAGVPVRIIPGKGTMVAMNHRMINTVLNRCKMPSDGDIIVPIHTVAVIGTTDEQVADPEHFQIEAWEVALMLAEGEKLVPGISQARVLRAWAGVRPLYQEGFAGESRDATRALTLLDHQRRDNVAGLITITGGKWTTFRLMAETAVDEACRHLGVQRPCTTATTPVPGVEQGHYWLGHRLHEVEERRMQNDLVCECELVTHGMLVHAARHNPTVTLDDLRRDVRLGMGPCQGGFCTYRAIGILHALGQSGDAGAHQALDESAWNVATMQSPAHSRHTHQPETDTHSADTHDADTHGAAGSVPSKVNANLLLRDFLQERWKGLLPILWGRQLKQERLDQLIYLGLLNADHLPDDGAASPLTDFYYNTAEPLDVASASSHAASSTTEAEDA